jgi:hypothetical protein
MIQFTAPTSIRGSAITNYEYSTDGGTNWVTPSPAITQSPLIISSGLTNCTSYAIKLRSVNASGSGNASATASLTPAASINLGINWTARSSAANNTWNSITYGNGLFLAVSQTGTGTASIGTFAGINCAAGTYFIKTETDPSGGTNYTITGTQEILSVPYAMYAAKSGDSTTMGAIGASATTNGGTITSGVLSLTPADATNSGIVTPFTQTFGGNKTFTSAIKITAGTPGEGKVLTSAATGLASWQSSSPCGYAIGQNVTALGGIIFYLDASGCHGLQCAPTDQSTGIIWYNGSNTNTTAFADCVGGGAGNTSMIVYNQGATATSYAAGLARAYTAGGAFSDYFLPSKYELNLMYKNIGRGNALGLGNVGGFANNTYWSSTEVDASSAWGQYFWDGIQFNHVAKFGTYYVRAVRAF